ncbi:MAG: DUF1330 domain-containing protein [Actinomycetota bacterium]
MAITLCVLLWVKDGQEELFESYEDKALEIATRHGGITVSRVRRTEGSEAPYEVQILQFPSDASLKEFMDDPARSELSEMRERSIAKTEVIRVNQIA